MYNLDARYKIIGRVMRGQTVLAYAVVDRHTNAKTLIAKNIAEEMALNKQFVNCFGQVYDNNINLKGIGCKLNQLPKYNEHGELIEIEEKHKKRMNDLRLIGKIQQGRNVVAYVLEAVNKAFKNILNNLYQSEIVDMDAEMKVFSSMLKVDGFDDNELEVNKEEEKWIKGNG